jgi:hypothetical protein
MAFRPAEFPSAFFRQPSVESRRPALCRFARIPMKSGLSPIILLLPIVFHPIPEHPARVEVKDTLMM